MRKQGSKQINAVVPDTEFAAFHEAARRAGHTLTVWMRTRLVAAAKRETPKDTHEAK